MTRIGLNIGTHVAQEKVRKRKSESLAFALQNLAAIACCLGLSSCADHPNAPDVKVAIEKPIEKPTLNLPQSPEAISAAIERGRIHFDTYACWRCHTLGTEELAGTPDFDNSGPDLEFIGDRLDPFAIHQSMVSPNKLIAEPKNDHITEQGFSKMPPFDSLIPEKELLDLVTFLTRKKQTNVTKSKPVIVTEANFETEVVAAKQLVLLDFWAEWCLPCLEIEPLLESIAADLGAQIKICKINVDDNPNLVADHVPDNMFPCLILMTNNTLIERVYGTDPKMEPKAFLDQWIDKYLTSD